MCKDTHFIPTSDESDYTHSGATM